MYGVGQLNQDELAIRTDHFLTTDPAIEHLHNQLIAGVLANVNRDPPEPGVAPFVSANDKPVVISKPVAGDAAEQRLKTEVMQLPARERRRLKDVPEVGLNTRRYLLMTYHTDYYFCSLRSTIPYQPASPTSTMRGSSGHQKQCRPVPVAKLVSALPSLLGYRKQLTYIKTGISKSANAMPSHWQPRQASSQTPKPFKAAWYQYATRNPYPMAARAPVPPSWQPQRNNSSKRCSQPCTTKPAAICPGEASTAY